MSQRLEILKDPNIKQEVTGAAIVSGIGGIKTDDGFKDIMGRIARANPTSPLAKEYGSKSPTDVKIREAVDREKVRQSK